MNILPSGLYIVSQHQQVNESNHYILILNPNHPIYEGHFPLNPILPGACFIQIATELAEQVIGQELRLTQLKAAKFPNPLNPNQTPSIDLIITCSPTLAGHWSVKAIASTSTTIFLKFQGTFVKYIPK